MDSRLRREHPSERPSHGNKVLGGIEKKYSGGMTDEKQGLDSRLRGNDGAHWE